LPSCSAQNDNDNDKLPNEDEIVVSSGKEEILFIGNSHTYYNQGISGHLLKFRNNDNLEFEPLIQEAAQGGYSLQDHLNDPSTIAKVKGRAWDFIILQENTSVAAETLQSTTDAMIAFSDLVSQNDTKILLFMTWPYKDNPEMLSGIKNTYQAGASAIKGTIVTIGEEWMAIDTNDEVEVNLYDADGIHPSREGTFFASAKFYKAIYKKPPSDNPYQAALGDVVANYLKTKAN
jgi:hypothetical protein